MNSDLLKKLRKEAGLTQSDMAQKLGYKHKTGYQALESGTVKTEVNTAFKIKDILKMKDEEFDAVFLDKSLVVEPYNEISEAKPVDKETELEQFETLLRETKKSYIQGIQLGLSISALIISVIALSMQLLK